MKLYDAELQAENIQIGVSRKNSTSQYKGVCWSSNAGKRLNNVKDNL